MILRGIFVRFLCVDGNKHIVSIGMGGCYRKIEWLDMFFQMDEWSGDNLCCTYMRLLGHRMHTSWMCRPKG